MIGISNSESFLMSLESSSKPRKNGVSLSSFLTIQASVKYSALSSSSKKRAKARLVILSAGLGSV